MKLTDLKKRLKAGEWNDAEFKEARTDVPKSAFEAVSAFANTHGGWLVFGVAQTGESYEICGVEKPDKIQSDFLSVLHADARINHDVDLTEQANKRRGKSRFSSPPMRYVIPPIGVVTRRSTEYFAVEDELVIDALKFIRINATLPLTVDQTAYHLAVSRRTLEMRFQKHLNRSVLSEIIRQRLERIKLMLCDKSMSIDEIASSCGFESEAYLCRFFHRETGQTMSEYRKRFTHCQGSVSLRVLPGTRIVAAPVVFRNCPAVFPISVSDRDGKSHSVLWFYRLGD